MASTSSSTTSCIQGNSYYISPQDYEKFHNDGYALANSRQAICACGHKQWLC